MTPLALIPPDAFQDGRDTAAHFNTMSLRSWLRIAGMAGVPAVGGTVIGKITESDMVVMIDILDGGDMELPRNVFNLAKAIEAHAGQDIMVRSDGGSGSSVKGFMGRKLEPGVERGFGDASHWFNGRGFITNDRPETLLKAMIDFDDDRLNTILMDWPEAELPMLARPLVKG